MAKYRPSEIGIFGITGPPPLKPPYFWPKGLWITECKVCVNAGAFSLVPTFTHFLGTVFDILNNWHVLCCLDEIENMCQRLRMGYLDKLVTRCKSVTWMDYTGGDSLCLLSTNQQMSLLDLCGRIRLSMGLLQHSVKGQSNTQSTIKK